MSQAPAKPADCPSPSYCERWGWRGPKRVRLWQCREAEMLRCPYYLAIQERLDATYGEDPDDRAAIEEARR